MTHDASVAPLTENEVRAIAADRLASCRSALLLLTLLVPLTVANAQGFTTDDTQLRFDGTSVSPLSGTARAGFTSAPGTGGGIVPIFVYRLPTLAVGTTITSAVLSLNVATIAVPGGINYNVDLYGIGFRTTPTITLADFFVGPSDMSGTATLLQDNFVTRLNPTSTTPTGRYETTTTGSANVAAFLNAQYAGGAVGGATGNFVFFRLSPDLTQAVNGATNFGGYDFNTQDNTSTSGLRPTLTLTTSAIGAAAPEPTALALLAVTLPVIGLFSQRRNRHQTA